MLKSCLASAVLACLAAPAWAQTDDLAGIDAIYDGAASGCLEAHSSTSITQQDRLATCQNELTVTDRIYAGRRPTKHETNIYYMHRAFLILEVGGAYLHIDGVRSARVCTQTEAALTELSHIADAESPSAYQNDYASMRSSIVKAAAVCRNQFGTPSGAVPLPPG